MRKGGGDGGNWTNIADRGCDDSECITAIYTYPANGVMVDLLKEEYYIRTKEDEFVLKAVEAGEQYNKYTATLNVEELEGQSFPYGFASQEQTIRACLTFAFEGTGWTVGTLNLRRSPAWGNENICGRAVRGQSYYVKEIHMVDGKKMVRTIDDLYLSGLSEHVQFEQL